MRWFYLTLAAASFLSGASAGQAASCTYSNVCAGTQVAGAPTYKKDCVFADNLTMASTVEIANDNAGPLTAVRVALRNICYDVNGVLVWDGTQQTGTFSCLANSGCATIVTQLKLTTQTLTGTCPCHTTDKYQTAFIVGDHWDATNGFRYTWKWSAFTTAP